MQVSSDLVIWNSGANYSWVLFAVSDGNDVTETVRVEIFGSVTSLGQRFVRLRVRLQ